MSVGFGDRDRGGYGDRDRGGYGDRDRDYNRSSGGRDDIKTGGGRWADSDDDEPPARRTGAGGEGWGVPKASGSSRWSDRREAPPAPQPMKSLPSRHLATQILAPTTAEKVPKTKTLISVLYSKKILVALNVGVV